VNGFSVNYQLTVTNTGNTGNTFEVAVSGAAWPTTPSVSSLPLNAGESYLVQVTVQIPQEATGEDQDFATITFSGTGGVSASAELTTTVDYHPPLFGVSIAPSAEMKSGDPGTTVIYEMTVTNTGLIGATYGIAVTGSTWTTTCYPDHMTLAVGTSELVTVYVQIPATAADGAIDTVIVTASNLFVSDSATLTTAANPLTFGVEMAPASSMGSGYPGQLVNYNLVVTNTGNITNTFSVQGNGGSWTTTPAENSLTLGGGKSAILAVTVAVPTGAMAAAEDTTTVIVSGAGGASQSAVLTTRANQVFALEISPGNNVKSGVPGTTVTYSLIIMNTGNGADTVEIDIFGTNWITTAATNGLPLAAGESAAITVSVAIPAEAVEGMTETATVTANGAGGVSAVVTLSTTATRQTEMYVFLPLLTR
jgi:uncharacterized membrane protein